MTSHSPGSPVEHLNDAERRLYELARQPMPLAEVAVRLGVATSEADRRIAALLAQLGVETRAALRTEYGPGGEGMSPASPQREIRNRRHWRWITIVAVAAPVLVVAGALAWESSGGTGRSDETQSTSQSAPGLPGSG